MNWQKQNPASLPPHQPLGHYLLMQPQSGARRTILCWGSWRPLELSHHVSGLIFSAFLLNTPPPFLSWLDVFAERSALLSEESLVHDSSIIQEVTKVIVIIYRGKHDSLPSHWATGSHPRFGGDSQQRVVTTVPQWKRQVPQWADGKKITVRSACSWALLHICGEQLSILTAPSKGRQEGGGRST